MLAAISAENGVEIYRVIVWYVNSGNVERMMLDIHRRGRAAFVFTDNNPYFKSKKTQKMARRLL